jgi:hypothetical protein
MPGQVQALSRDEHCCVLCIIPDSWGCINELMFEAHHSISMQPAAPALLPACTWEAPPSWAIIVISLTV